MLTIRLQRVGKKKVPTYRLIISEKTRDTFGTYLEELGTFNPHLKENQINVNAERIKYWISKGAQMSATVSNLLISNNIIEGKKRKSVYLSDDRRKKMAEKDKAKTDAVEKEKAASAAKAEAEKVAAEAEAEKAKAEAEAAKAVEAVVETPVATPAPEVAVETPVAPVEAKPAAEPAPEKPAETPIEAPKDIAETPAA